MKHPVKCMSLDAGTFRQFGPCDGCMPEAPAYESDPGSLMWRLVIGKRRVALCPECATALSIAWDVYGRQMETWKP